MRFLGGMLLGAVAAAIALSFIKPANTSDCCKRVAAAVRERATEALDDYVTGKTGVAGLGDAAGDILGDLGDTLGAWKRAPGLLDTFNIEA